eukprot:3718848-Pleurochrysis_carterae.AAC.2
MIPPTIYTLPRSNSRRGSCASGDSQTSSSYGQCSSARSDTRVMSGHSFQKPSEGREPGLLFASERAVRKSDNGRSALRLIP